MYLMHLMYVMYVMNEIYVMYVMYECMLSIKYKFQIQNQIQLFQCM